MQEIKTWKVWGNFFGYFFIFIIGASIAAIPRFIKGFDNETGLLVSISEIIRIFITILLLYWYTKYVVKLPLNIPTLNAKSLNMGLWILIGLSLPILTVVTFYITGNLSVSNLDTEFSRSYLFDALLQAFVGSLAAGFVEEIIFFFSSRRRHTRCYRDWSSDVCSSDLMIRHTRCYRDWSSDVCSSD